LKKFLLILSFIVFTLSSQAQNRENPSALPGAIIRFYPNPATTAITFDLKAMDKGYSLQIFNFLGKRMHEQVNITDRTVINLSDFARGVYIYQLRDKTGRIVESGKFQVSK
jgi:hypothetical protein